jgi:hypothetical protein
MDPTGRCPVGNPASRGVGPRQDGCYADDFRVADGYEAHNAHIASNRACNAHASCYADCNAAKDACDVDLRVALHAICNPTHTTTYGDAEREQAGNWIRQPPVCDAEGMAAAQSTPGAWTEANERHCVCA